MKNKRGTHWRTEQHRAAIEYAEGQEAVTRCALCRWRFRGLIRDGKRAFEEHRRLAHPEKVAA